VPAGRNGIERDQFTALQTRKHRHFVALDRTKPHLAQAGGAGGVDHIHSRNLTALQYRTRWYAQL
jgi:hypothetical protein